MIVDGTRPETECLRTPSIRVTFLFMPNKFLKRILRLVLARKCLLYCPCVRQGYTYLKTFHRKSLFNIRA